MGRLDVHRIYPNAGRYSHIVVRTQKQIVYRHPHIHTLSPLSIRRPGSGDLGPKKEKEDYCCNEPCAKLHRPDAPPCRRCRLKLVRMVVEKLGQISGVYLDDFFDTGVVKLETQKYLESVSKQP